MLRVRRRVVGPMVAIGVALALLISPGAAAADTASELEDIRAKVAEAQAAANAGADKLSAAEERLQQIQGRIEGLQTEIGATQERIAILEGLVRDRAVTAYVSSGASDKFASIFTSRGPLEAARRARFLDQANQKDNQAITELAGLREQLAEQQDTLESERETQQVVKERLAAEQIALQDGLAEVSRLRDELATRLEQEQAAAAAAEAARLRALQAASQPRPASPGGTSSGGGAGQVIANPGGGSFQCPVSGAAYSDNYGPRGSGFHYGIDMFTSTGVPLVAVKSGTVGFTASGGAGGNEAYLSANDGNVYYYAHLSQFVGGSRSVSQGEVIGLVGSTGNSTAPHLHFEIRVGGANGQRIDPYPTLQSAGC